MQSLTLAGEGPLTRGGGARFFGLARGSSSWGAGPACFARFLKAAAKLLLFCCPPGPGPGVWPWGSTELGRWDLPIEVGWALVLAGCRPEMKRRKVRRGPCEITPPRIMWNSLAASKDAYLTLTGLGNTSTWRRVAFNVEQWSRATTFANYYWKRSAKLIGLMKISNDTWRTVSFWNMSHVRLSRAKI